MPDIHPTAIVGPGAELGKGVTVGPYTLIEDDVVVGDDSKILSHATLESGTRLGKGVTVGRGAVLGGAPQDLKFAGEKTYLEIGDGTTIREYATLNRGTSYAYKTVVGKDCFIMAYVHIAHDCVIGNNVVLANAVTMGGHVVIEDFVGVGGLTAIHQFVRIGKQCFVGGGSKVSKDVPPFILAMGEPLQYGGVNFVGMSRRGFSEEALAQIKRAYRIVFRSNLTRKEALAKIRSDMELTADIESIIGFVEVSERGLIRG